MYGHGLFGESSPFASIHTDDFLYLCLGYSNLRHFRLHCHLHFQYCPVDLQDGSIDLQKTSQSCESFSVKFISETVFDSKLLQCAHIRRWLVCMSTQVHQIMISMSNLRVYLGSLQSAAVGRRSCWVVAAGTAVVRQGPCSQVAEY